MADWNDLRYLLELSRAGTLAAGFLATPLITALERSLGPTGREREAQ